MTVTNQDQKVELIDLTHITADVAVGSSGRTTLEREFPAPVSPYVLNEANAYQHKQFYTSFHNNKKHRRTSLGCRRRGLGEHRNTQLSSPQGKSARLNLDSARSQRDQSIPSDGKAILLIH